MLRGIMSAILFESFKYFHTKSYFYAILCIFLYKRKTLDKRDELTKKLQKEDAWQELLYQNKDKRIWMKFT